MWNVAAPCVLPRRCEELEDGVVTDAGVDTGTRTTTGSRIEWVQVVVQVRLDRGGVDGQCDLWWAVAVVFSTRPHLPATLTHRH